LNEGVPRSVQIQNKYPRNRGKRTFPSNQEIFLRKEKKKRRGQLTENRRDCATISADFKKKSGRGEEARRAGIGGVGVWLGR